MAPDPSDDVRKSALRSQIDENLRRVYQTALDDSVPERFTRLLQQLREGGGRAMPEGESEAQAMPTSSAPVPSGPESGA